MLMEIDPKMTGQALNHLDTLHSSNIKWESNTLIRKEGNVYLMMHSTHLILRLYGVGHIVKDHSVSEKGNPLPPVHGLLFLINRKSSFICTNPQTA